MEKRNLKKKKRKQIDRNFDLTDIFSINNNLPLRGKIDKFFVVSFNIINLSRR